MLFSLMSVNPVVHLAGDPMVNASKSNVDILKRIIRQNQGKLDFRMGSDMSSLPEYLDMMFKIEQNSAKKLHSKDLFSKAENRLFYANLIKYCAKFVKIGFLYYDNIPIVYQFGFLYRDIFAAYQTAYLAEYRKLRPGKTMLMHLMNDLKNVNVNTLDLGGGISSYKTEFTSDRRFLYDIYLSNNPFVMAWWKLINSVGRTKKILMPEKNTQDHKYIFKTIQQNYAQTIT
jgi:CelD/BcsL family acetyltransferase involved in cellulose biosynthesis